ncbi:Type 1 glutamine amidotransferase-like domain-containing protein [Capnocytophaga cynodegmi]|uniref:Type 1 glutamine amidotransferase-like domain-containing protein n=1 Tax=Capnocytophaga cynodegmi TaxID=28189 RepID=UPI00385B3A0A
MRFRVVYLFVIFSLGFINGLKAQHKTQKEEIIFIWGGDINLKFTEYIMGLTNKKNPKICYVPTASADNSENIKYWKNICDKLKIETIVLNVWVSSSNENQSFEEILLNCDAIIVGGGNTLNMIGIWKAQQIDDVLRKALKKGIILAGGSAGSICWFENGISDSRPTNLSIVDGLAFLPYSNCPHYSQKERQNLYHQMIMENKIKSGYATDELAGILFKNGKVVDFISQSDMHNCYHVYSEKGDVKSVKMNSKIVLRPNAIPENSYTNQLVNKKIKDLLTLSDIKTPLTAYISEMKKMILDKDGINDSKRDEILNINIEKIFVYQDKIAGIVNDAYIDDFGYGIRYFYNCNGFWVSMGEDIGGETLLESEITFREKAKIIIQRAEEKSVCEKSQTIVNDKSTQ